MNFFKKIFNSSPKERNENDDNLNFPDFKYKYAKNKMPYGTEELYISPSEKSQLKEMLDNSIQKNQNSFSNFLSEELNKKPKKIIIDTDIGTDFDDILSLMLALNIDQKDANLLGITTNYHPTLLRKRVVDEILAKAGSPFDKVKVIAGPSHLCGTHREYFHHGNEGKGLNLLKKEEKDLWKNNKSLEAVEFIYQMCKENPKEITIVSIGIPTNLGLCTHLYKDFGNLVGHIVVMGGGSLMTHSKCKESQKDAFFQFPLSPSDVFEKKSQTKIAGFHLFPNHNISGDTLASKMLFDSDCKISVIPHHITSQYWLEGKSIETLLHHGMSKNSPLKNEIPLCGRLAYEWLSRRWHQRGQCVHDPLTVYEAIFPEEHEKEIFVEGKSNLVYMRGNFLVHEWAAFMSFVKDPQGKHRVAIEAKEPNEFLKWLEEKLLAKVDLKERVEKWKGNY